MLNWLKYFGLNFFSKKYADESKDRSLGNGVLALFIATIILFVAFCGMSKVTFSVRYGNSASFKEYYHGLFDGDHAISIAVEKGKASYAVDGNNAVINSFVNDADNVYARNGYNLVVDMRDGKTLYDDCTVEFVNNQNSADVVSYEEYQSFENSKKENYSAKLILTEKVKEFSAESVKEYVSFVNEHGDDSAKQTLATLENNGIVAEENYGAVWQLYFQTKYGALGNSFTSAPTMRDYYITTYLATDDSGKSVYKDYVILLSDIVLMNWTADDGHIMSVTGYYGDNALTVNSADSADQLMADLYDVNTLSVAINYFLFVVRAVLGLCVVWLLLTALLAIVGYLFKINALGFGAVGKTMGAFWLGSMLPALLFVLVASSLLTQTQVFYVAIAIWLVTDIVRTLVHCIHCVVQELKARKSDVVESIDKK